MILVDVSTALREIESEVRDAETVGLIASVFLGAESRSELREIGKRFAADPLSKQLQTADIAALRCLYADCDRVLGFPQDLPWKELPNVSEVASRSSVGTLPDLWTP